MLAFILTCVVGGNSVPISTAISALAMIELARYRRLKKEHERGKERK
jgi:hypothetical protein